MLVIYIYILIVIFINNYMLTSHVQFPFDRTCKPNSHHLKFKCLIWKDSKEVGGEQIYFLVKHCLIKNFCSK